jgi:hypothetical protein
MKITTNSQAPEEPKETEGCALFEMYRAFATPEQVSQMRAKFAEGIGWGFVKQELFEVVNAQLAEPREKYAQLMQNPVYIEKVLKEGAAKARAYSRPFWTASASPWESGRSRPKPGLVFKSFFFVGIVFRATEDIMGAAKKVVQLDSKATRKEPARKKVKKVELTEVVRELSRSPHHSMSSRTWPAA